MRVAFVSQPIDGPLPPPRNSIAIWTYEVARRLKEGHEVTVFYPAGRRLRSRVEEGVRYVQVPCLGDRFVRMVLGRFCAKSGGFAPESLFYAPVYGTFLCLLTLINRFDIIHIHNFGQLGRFCRLFARHGKILLHMHCEWVSQFRESSIRKALKAVSGVVFCSSYLREKANDRLAANYMPGYVLANGVNRTAMNSISGPLGEKESIDILFVGRVSPEKGVHLLVKAFENVITRVPQARLRLVGALSPLPRDYLESLSSDEAMRALFCDEALCSDYISYLKRLAAKLPEGTVEFVGSVPHQDVARLYRSSAVLVNPSLSEAFGMSLVEAMSCGLPVIASRAGGMVEVLGADQGPGLLVEKDDAIALADAIVRIVCDPVLAAAKGEAGLKRSEIFDWDEIAQGANSLYDRLVR